MLSEVRALPGSIWKAQLLGGLVLSHGDLVIDRFGSQHAERLLARLLLAPRTRWARDELARQLWPELCVDGVATDIAIRRLRHTLSTLRVPLKAPLGFEPFDDDRDHVRLNAPAFDIDVDRFERHAARGQWAAALACWRGELLPGLHDEFIDAERRRLLARRDVALREVDPDRVHDDADGHGGDGDDDARPAASTRPLTPYLTRFFGREAEIDRLCNAVAAHRIVTLRGVGGCGKTRLAMHAMHDMAGFDSMRFVALADCECAALLVEHVRAAFGIQSSGRPAIEQLAVRLGGQRVLLVLDNLEQLVGAELDAALNTLQGRLPHAHLLVTSRRSLGRPDENLIELQPLPIGELGAAASGPAVALFVDRARAARGDFSLTRANAAAVADICRRLDGLPLAIELAAAQIRRHTPREMLRAVTASLAWLARPAQRAMRDGRHGSLEAALHWSWRLLEPQARALLGHLSAFRGGWTQAQAQAISDHADALSVLVDASLVQQAEGPAARLQMLHVVREFVVAQLDLTQRALARQRHRSVFGALAQSLDQAHEWPALADGPNFVQAAQSAWDDGDASAAAALIQALDAHWRARGAPDELRTLLPQLAAHESLPAARRVDMLLLQAALLLEAGSSFEQAASALPVNVNEALATLDRAMKAAGHDTPLVACVTLSQAWIQWRPIGDAPRALELLARTEKTLIDDTAPPLWRARWLLLRGAIATEHERDAAAGMAHFERAERLVQSIGDRRTSLQALPGRAACLLFAQRFREAASVAAAGAKLAADLGDMKIEVQLLNRLALAHEQLKQWDASLDANRREARVAHTHGLHQFLAYALWNQPLALANLGHAEDAMRLMAFARTYWLRWSTTLTDDDEVWIRDVRRLAEARLGAARCDALWSEGLALGDHAALALALGGERERGRSGQR